MTNIKDAPKLSVKSEQKWFKQLPHESEFTKVKFSPDLISSLKAEAQNFLDSETKLYHKLKENRKDKDFAWIKKILQAGTLSDKVSAHTVLIQDCPVYNLHSLECLISMVTTKGKRECLMAMDSLQDLFSVNLIKKDEKLSSFEQHPLSNLKELTEGLTENRKKILILWQFEDKLKSLYKNFLKNVEAVSHDTIEKTKLKAITVLAKLLKENSEEEQFLVDKLVNKIGDPIPKVGSHVCHQLSVTVSQKPQKKLSIVNEVERFLYRPNMSERGKYYSLCFLSEVILTHNEFALANSLVMIYFGQLKLFMKQGEVDNRMMRALLTGVARAFPYSKLKDNVIFEQLDAMYKLVHIVSFNISVQALIVIFEVLDSSNSLSDRFYGVLYRKLLDPAFSTSSRQASMLHLLFRALKKDVAIIRIKVFIKRMLQVALYQEPNMQCGILMIISKLSQLHPNLNLMEVKRSFIDDSDSEEHYEDLPSDDEETDKKPTIKTEKPKPSKSNNVHDLDCRNPLHSPAANQQLWDLIYLKRCFHPSVSLFAHQVANDTEIKYSGDPLLDFTTSRFLDRFVYRNPKQCAESFKEDPRNKVFGKRKLNEKNIKKYPVTSNEFLQERESRVPCEEMFLYQYMKKRAQTGKKVGKKDDSDIESVGSDEFEDLLNDMNVDDEGKDTLNFAQELGLYKQKKKGQKRSAPSDSDLEDDDDDDLLEDIDADELDDEEMKFEGEDFDDDDEDKFEGEDFDIDEDICEDDFVGLDLQSKKSKKKSKSKKDSGPDDELFAAAEEFSTLLEDGADEGIDTTTSEAVRTKDKSSAKQLKWELDRDRKFRNQGKSKKQKPFRKKFKKHRA